MFGTYAIYEQKYNTFLVRIGINFSLGFILSILLKK